VGQVLRPMFGAELERARATELLAEGLRDRRRRRSRRERAGGGSLRLAVGMRLVAMGFRLLGEGVEVR